MKTKIRTYGDKVYISFHYEKSTQIWIFFSGQYFHVFGLNTGITQNYTKLVVLVNVENEDFGTV